MKPRIFHVITKLELGGAQKVTLMTLDRLPRDLYDIALITGPEGMLVEQAKRIPRMQCFWLPELVREIRPLKDIVAFYKLWRLFRRERPTIVHTHSSKAGILGRWAAWLARVPYIFHTAHGFGFNDHQNAITRALYIWIERFSGWITTQPVVVSLANAARAERLGILAPGEWILCRDAIDLQEFSEPNISPGAVARWGIPEDRLIVGMVACFKPQKAPIDFVDLAARILEEHENVHFVMAGDGELRADIEARIRTAGIGSRMTLVGWQRDMPEVYRNLDVFVLTSLWEGQPCVFAEAMASGLPIVATAADGAREAVVDGETGFVCSPRDVRALSEALGRLIVDPDLRRRMGEQARARVREFDIEVSVARLESAYRACVENEPGPAAVPHTP